MRIAFIVPAPLAGLTGSREYARRMIAAWRDAGHDVTVHDVSSQHVDHAGGAPAHPVWAGIDPTAAIVVDNQALESVAACRPGFFEHRVVVLNHHPLGLETGLSAALSDNLTAMERRITLQACHVVTTSQTTAASIATLFALPPDRISIIEPGTPDAPRSTGAAAGAGPHPTEVISIGSLIPRKGHDVLLRAMARLFDLDWHLTIAGSAEHDPSCAAALEALAATLDIRSRVTFLGPLQGQALSDLWCRADLFALATHHEGYGMAIAEALKRGLPVAVCNGGAAGALVTPASGVVCPPGDVDQLSKALRRLIFDRGLRKATAEAAWAIGQSLPDWPQQAAAFVRVLQTHASPEGG